MELDLPISRGCEGLGRVSRNKKNGLFCSFTHELSRRETCNLHVFNTQQLDEITRRANVTNSRKIKKTICWLWGPDCKLETDEI